MLTFMKSSLIDKSAVVYAFLPILAMVIIKFVLELTLSKRREGTCTMILCKMFIKILVLFSALLGLLKLQGFIASISWANIVISLWIVTAIIGSFFLIISVIFLSRLMSSMILCRVQGSELITTLWLTLNTGVLMGVATYLQIQGPKFGDNKASIDVFFSAGLTLAVSAVVIGALTFAYHKTIQ